MYVNGKKPKLFLILAAIILAGFATATETRADTVVFQQDFNNVALGLGFSNSVAGFNVIAGDVDIHRNGEYGTRGDGNYLDLDGYRAGTIQTNLLFAPGIYNLQFALSGSQRGDTNSVIVSFGNFTQTFTLASNAPFQMYNFNVFVAQSSYLTFQSLSSSDLFGLLLDNVTVTNVTAAAVPEPATILLLGTGLTGIATRLKKRHRNV